MEGLHPGRVRIRCATCGLEVERIVLEEGLNKDWLCPGCDPDTGADEPEHSSVWDDAVEDGITKVYIKPGWGERKTRKSGRRTPAWAANLNDFREVIWAHSQAKRWANRWALVAYLYHRMGWPAEDVGRYCELSVRTVKRIIQRLDNRAAKLQARKKSPIPMPTAEQLRKMSIRQIAARLKCSVGKAHALKKLALSA